MTRLGRCMSRGCAWRFRSGTDAYCPEHQADVGNACTTLLLPKQEMHRLDRLLAALPAGGVR
jgi:hypothetical protein